MFFGIGCIIFGFLLIFLGVSSRRRAKSDRGTCTERVSATVIGHEEVCLKNELGADTWAFCPRFRFVTKNGTVEATADWGTVNPRFHERQHVILYYDPSEPSRICVNDNRGTAGSLIGCIIFGALLVLSGIGTLFLL